ncbi:glycosyltransferase [Caldivirga maquilingensis]|uniref:Glycosyl transferase family 2 n=1 Tax=Caldivirga maquilingensis (strain ATCC 700844 / DSM 13496 / JCM 10307 / IC-167) TaxID=397948 RepID=A8ME67_CALMQ|nr:glycosyltransferase family 2 protein [Caldivirga maquilingensis]ABW02073.1 glycosyl transferase family 2 [Caldivirga maquilingensis IC-167]
MLILQVLGLLIVIAAASSSILSLYFEVKYWRSLRDPVNDGEYPSVTVIMPIRGVDQNLEGNVRSVLEQKYPAAKEYLFIFDDVNDPAYGLVSRIIEGYSNARIIINNAGSSKGSALVKGINEAKGDVVVIVDSDAYVHDEWLINLVNLLKAGSGAATTYRFYAPLSRLSLGLLLKASFNMIGITAMQNDTARFAWGGSTAVWRKLILKWELVKYLPHYLSDDYVITHMVHRDGLKVGFTPRSMVITLEDSGVKDAFKWAVRQLWYVKVYGFNGFILYTASYTLYAFTLPIALALSLFINWVIILGLAPYLIGVIKDYYRISRIRSQGVFYASNIGGRYAYALAAASILNVYFSWLAIIVTAFTKSINWRGRVFTIQDVKRGIESMPLP